MKTSYVCKYHLYHDKPCVGTYDESVRVGSEPKVIYEPSSNNGWIYTAFAQAIDKIVNKDEVLKTFTKCNLSTLLKFEIDRLPGKATPPLSRDEVIGMVSLGLLKPSFLIYHKWIFYGSASYLPPLFKQFEAVWGLRGKHRNHVWENGITNAYPIVFRLFWHDRYFIKKYHKQKTTKFEFVMFYLYVISTILQNNISAKNILWLQLHKLKSRFIIKLINRRKNFLTYFGPQHDFNNYTLSDRYRFF